MSLAPGTRLGPYEVIAPLGAGGMGEVYRARDTKLGRDVALKILPDAFASDPERLARFEREARTLAAFNHPHIAQIYGLEGGTLVPPHGAAEGHPTQQAAPSTLVMELVEGTDLTERIAQGPIPLEETLPIARQIAEALEAAHEQGIIHRDLKPANIKIRADGMVKVLDFGLAKALDPTPSGVGTRHGSPLQDSPTITSPARLRQGYGEAGTEIGIILGTAAYMSPEQAKGKAVDKRADIWAFGCVLYEMLSGRRAFDGESITELLSAVTRDAPDFRALPLDTPRSVHRLIARCLEKDPKQRLRDIGDARIELESRTEAEPTLPSESRGRRGVPIWTLLVITAITAGIAATAARLMAPAARTEAPVRRFDIQARDLRAEPHRHPMISPDGRRVAWAAGGSLWLREMDRTEARVLIPGVDPQHLAWSPDSQEILFFSANRLWRVRTTGGEPVVIAEATFRRGATSPGAAWLDDGRIVFAPSSTGSGLLVVDARGGAFQSFLDVQPGIADFHSASPLPGSRGVLVVADREREGTDLVAVVADGKLHPVIQEAGERFESPVYSTAGFVLFERQVTGRGVWAIPYSLDRLAPTGSPFLVAANASWPSVSVDGTLAHTRLDAGALLEIALADRSGAVIKTVGEPAITLFGPRVSPDGQRIVATLRDESGTRDLYSFDVATGTRTRLTFGTNPAWPRWAPGNRVLLESGARGTEARTVIAAISAEGGGKAQELVRGDGVDADISSDGRWLVYYRPTRERGADIFARQLDPKTLLPVEGQAEIPVVAGPNNENRPLIHPSTTFLAYHGADTGRFELYVTRFPDGQGKWQVTTTGADYAMWAPSGDALLYAQGNRIMEVPMTLGASVTIGTPRQVLDADATRALLDQTFDVTKDGKQIVFIRRPVSAGETLGTITIVQNWLEEFRTRAH